MYLCGFCIAILQQRHHQCQFGDICPHAQIYWGFLGGSLVKNLPAKVGAIGDLGLIPECGRSPGGRNGNPRQYSWLGNPTDRRAWQATVLGVTKSQTQLRWLSTHKNVLKSFIKCDIPRVKSWGLFGFLS